MKRILLVLLIGFLLAVPLFSADMSKFYLLVNDYRQRLGLEPVVRDVGLERYAAHYNEVILDNGYIEHHLIENEMVVWYVNHYSDYDYYSIFEILQSGPFDVMNNFVSIFKYFLGSPDHKKYIVSPAAETIGAATTVSGNGILVFTAYLGDIDGDSETELTRYENARNSLE